MFVVLGRITSAARKVNVTNERNFSKWVSFIKELDTTFNFSEMWDIDPEIFSR